jgi:cysteine synthase
VIDAMVKVPDVWSLAAMRALSQQLGRLVGGSTGTNLIAALACADHMKQRHQTGSIVTLLCDAGERYRDRYFNDHWLHSQGLSCHEECGAVQQLMAQGVWPQALRDSWRLAGLAG